MLKIQATVASLILLVKFCISFVSNSCPLYYQNTELDMRSVQDSWLSSSDKVRDLRRILFESDELTIMPCCYDGLTARLVEQAGFKLTFMTGFGVSSTYGLPDTGNYLSP